MEDKKEIYYKYFEEKVLPVIKPVEDYRLKTVRRVIVSTILFFAAGIIFAALIVFNSLNKFLNPLLFPIILFFMYAFILKGIIGAIIAGKEFQKKLVRDVLPLFFPPVANFMPWSENPDVETVINSGLFPNFETREDSLSFFGIYKNTNIIVSETMLTIPVKRELFKGTTIQLEFGKSLNNHIVLISKNERKFNNYRQFNPHIKEFNQYLYTFAANNEHLEFLNEDFWRIIKRIGEYYTAKGFAFSVKGNTVLIAMRHKKPMQFGFLFRSLLKPKNYDDIIKRFIIIYDLIDYLNDRL